MLGVAGKIYEFETNPTSPVFIQAEDLTEKQKSKYCSLCRILYSSRHLQTQISQCILNGSRLKMNAHIESKRFYCVWNHSVIQCTIELSLSTTVT